MEFDIIGNELVLLQKERNVLTGKMRELERNVFTYNTRELKAMKQKIHDRLIDIDKLIELNNIEYDNFQLASIV